MRAHQRVTRDETTRRDKHVGKHSLFCSGAFCVGRRTTLTDPKVKFTVPPHACHRHVEVMERVRPNVGRTRYLARHTAPFSSGMPVRTECGARLGQLGCLELIS
jgi:hypothetical protein